MRKRTVFRGRPGHIDNTLGGVEVGVHHISATSSRLETERDRAYGLRTAQ